MASKKTPAAAAFEKLGAKPVDYTPAMRLAVKQKWTDLPTEVPVAELRERLAALEAPSVPTLAELEADESVTDPAGELVRLKRNAAVNAWRARNRLQAALDARNLRYAALRSAKKAS